MLRYDPETADGWKPDRTSLARARCLTARGLEPEQLRIAHGVGVTPVAVYELKRVDSDFFADE